MYFSILILPKLHRFNKTMANELFQFYSEISDALKFYIEAKESICLNNKVILLQPDGPGAFRHNYDTI